MIGMLIGATLWAAAAAPANFEKLSQEAAAARDGNRLEDAIRLYGEAVRAKPEWKEGWWYLGTLNYDQDHYAACRDSFRRFVKLEPKAGPGWALLGLCEFETKQYDAALADLRHAEVVGLSNDPQMTKVARFHEALLLARLENYEQALQIYTQLAELGDNSALTVAGAGLAGLRMPIFPQEVQPQDKEIVMMAGQAVFDISDRKPQQALEDFEQMLAKYPNRPNVHYMYGIYLLKGDSDKAVVELKKELEISPDHIPALVALGLEYLKRGEAAKAVEFGREAVKARPDLFVTHNVLGRALVESGQVPEGIKELETARRLAPDSPQTHIALASAYAKAGRAAEAAKERTEFLRLNQELQKMGGP